VEIRDVGHFVAWFESVRRRTRAVAASVPEDRLEWSPGPGRFSAGDLIRHIAGTERWMWAENARLAPSRYPGHGRDLADGKTEVLAYMDRLHAETLEILRDLRADDLEARCTTVGGADMRVWKWLRLMVEHEIHHRGQLYALLAEMGVETPPLYGLTEPEVRARSRA
jgi:uncharacterized damage-inducible protein DinB